MRASEVPVLIVGGGAAGTMLSLELARHGVEARTVDRLPGPGKTSRAIVVHARTLEILERIDKDLAARYLDHGIHNKGYDLHFVDGAGKRRVVRKSLDFTTLDCRYPFLLVHGQSDSENNLRDYLRANFGRATDWSTQCTAVTQDGDGVTATLVHADRGGEEEQVRCEYLVAGDGINSRVRRSLGLEQEGSDYKGTVLQNMDAFLDGFPDSGDFVHYCAGTDHFIMIVKLPGGFYRMLLSDRGEAADPNITPQRAFMRLVDKHFDGVSLGDIVWHSKWESWVRLAKNYREGRVFLAGDSAHVHSTTGGQGMNCCMQDAYNLGWKLGDIVWHSKWESWVRLAKNYREGRVFLAGDSAHVHSTTGGQGMNCCMQDAYNLGWKLGMALRGLAKPELLDTYVSERRPIAEQVIWAASSLHEIFMGHGKDIQERAKRMNDKVFLDKVVGVCSGISYTYRDYIPAVTGLATLPGPAIGDRAPDVDLEGGGALFDATRHTGFTLLLLPGSRRAHGARLEVEISNTALERVQRRFPRVRAQRLQASAALDRAYGSVLDDRLLLIRPDGYVGFHCLAGEVARLEAYLGGILLG